jgi:hypothetical protein
MGSNSSFKRKLLLPFFFVAPAAFCLLFYYYYVRKPLIQENVPVFKTLKHFGPIKGISRVGDTSFYKLDLPNLYSPQKKDSLNTEGRMLVVQFSENINDKQQGMVCANLFRIQKRVNHIKGLKFVSIIDGNSEKSEKVALENIRKVHAGEIWDFYCLETSKSNNLKQQFFTALPNLNNDSLKTSLFLVDPNMQIRGHYYGNSVNSVNTLQSEIVVLNGEIKFSKKQKKNLK